ncbi:putative aminomethyltransferase protein [Diplodia seriata]|uniref:Putative aminomethyltransferase protein n=1 Tax=Diplodia seriata TaxID=420778 RepID=A0A0G2E8C5_9PEZI|nr:putative aminomethyltransferase protein [Diplodia seriata]
MTGERQSVPARHGIATFVPKGHSIKVINTYGSQVISTWVFALHKPPNAESEAEERAEEEAFNQAQREAEREAIAQQQQQQQQSATADTQPSDITSEVIAENQEEPIANQETPLKDEPQAGQAMANAEASTGPAAKSTVQTVDGKKVRSWTSYVPSVPSVSALRYRNKAPAAQANKDAVKSSEGQVEESSKETAETNQDEKKEEGTESRDPDKVEATAAESPGSTVHADDEGLKVAGTVTPSETTEDDYADAKSVQSSRSWGSYLPSIRSRARAASGKDSKSGADDKLDKANQRTWLSYLPSGTSFTSYLPSNSKDALSAFASSHHRDPTKSYAEQLYEFSKTPVGAASLSAATGSGTASSLYAAYSAYTKLQASQRITGPMEYLSLPHTIDALQKLSPEPGDTLLSNLHEPLLTLLDDTSPPATTNTHAESAAAIPLRHGTFLPACDPTTYRNLAGPGGNGEEHGSCAENLVLALQEFNKSTGLKGARTVGADVTINSAPVPLSLFMNTSVQQQQQQRGGSGNVVVEEPRRFEGGRWGKGGEKGGWVKFRAERDVVVVMSACPMDEGPMNGGRCMAANFVVEEPVGEGKEEGEAAKVGEGEEKGKKVEQKGPAKAKVQTSSEKINAKKVEAKKGLAKEEPKKTPAKEEPKKVPAKKPTPAATAPPPEVKGKRRDSALGVTEGAQPKVKKPPVIQRAKSAVEGRVKSPVPDRVKSPIGDRAKSPVSGVQSPRTGASTPSSDTIRNTPKPGKKKPKKLERRSSSMAPA